MKHKHDDDNNDRALEEVTAHAMAAEIAAELADELGDITLDLAVKHLPAVPSVREVRTLLDCARDEPRDYLMLRLFYYTGVRVGELAAMCLADIYDDGRVFVREGKGGRDRYTLLDARTLQLLRKWQGDRPLSERILDLHERQIERIVHEYGRGAGLVQKYEAMLRTFSAHSLRHAFGTHRYDAGMDLATIQQLLGHRFLATTLIYVRTSMKHMHKAYRHTDPLR